MNEFFISSYPNDTISTYAERLCRISSVLDYTVIAYDQIITGKFNGKEIKVWPASTPASIVAEL